MSLEHAYEVTGEVAVGPRRGHVQHAVLDHVSHFVVRYLTLVGAVDGLLGGLVEALVVYVLENNLVFFLNKKSEFVYCEKFF
jgi:predicted ABC-type sugar transport system permease subunit